MLLEDQIDIMVYSEGIPSDKLYNLTYDEVEIKNGTMILNDTGKIAQQCWLKIPNHFPNAELDEFVIIPNHIHGIIVLNNIVGVQNNAGVQNDVGVQNFEP